MAAMCLLTGAIRDTVCTTLSSPDTRPTLAEISNFLGDAFPSVLWDQLCSVRPSLFLQNPNFPIFEKFKNSKLCFKVKQKSRPLSEYLISYRAPAHRSIASNVSFKKNSSTTKSTPDL
jgi:hypothetical protein